MAENTASKTGSRFTTSKLVTMALFAAILCVSAYISIPLPFPGAPHITLLNFVIILIALLFPSLEAFLIIFVWMLLGMIGLPVFIAGGSGVGYLIAPYGMYTATFPVVGLLLPLVRGKKYNRLRYTLAAVLGVLFIDFIGMLWLMYSTKIGIGTAFVTGFLDFLPLDLVKAVIAAQIVPAFNRVMRQNR